MKLSQAELAASAECSPQLVSKMELGEIPINDRFRAIFASIFGVEEGDILTQQRQIVMEDRCICSTKNDLQEVFEYLPTPVLVEAHSKATEKKDWGTAEILARLLKDRNDVETH